MSEDLFYVLLCGIGLAVFFRGLTAVYVLALMDRRDTEKAHLLKWT